MINRYQDELSNIPAPGGGGCHGKLLGVANYGVLAGVNPEQIFNDIRALIPAGGRKVPDREIWDAVNKAVAEVEPMGERRELTPDEKRVYAQRKQADEARQAAEQREAKRVAAIVDAIPDATTVDIWNRSPVKLTGDPMSDLNRLLFSLYWQSELIWCGSTYDKHPPRRPFEWLAEWRQGRPMPNFIIPNPLSEQQHIASSGELSYRCDAAVVSHRFCLVEFDELTIEQQAGRINWMLNRRKPWPIATVIHSGSKSLHAWLKVNVHDAAAWKSHVYDDLFPSILIPMGADRACRNAARLSRLPGAVRQHDDGRQVQQQLLYLNPNL